TLVLMPVLLYPLLTIAFRQFLLASKKEEKQTPEYGICFASTEEANVVMSLLERGGEALLRTPSPVGAGVKAPPQRVARLVPQGPAGPRSAVEAKQADLGLRLRLPQRREFPFNVGVERALDLEVYYLEDSREGREALEQFQRRLDAAHRQMLFE